MPNRITGGDLKIDSIINSRWILPVDPADSELAYHSLAISGGRIVDILPTETARARYRPEVEHQLPNHVLIPGLVNTHTHASMTLLRGLADDLPLMTWLNEHIWPAEKQWVNEEFVADGTRLAIAEMLRGGITCFNDMYFYPDVTGRVAAAAGMRAVVGLIILDFPSAWAANADDYLRKGLEVHDHFRHDSLIRTAFAPHAPYSVSNAPLERVRTLADELDIPIHMHVHETRDEVSQSLAQFGCRPLQRLESLGLASPALVAVHMTQLEDDELEQFSKSGASIVHCPESNLKLASGFCPVAKLLGAGINVALGTDGAASNNDLNLFGEMRTAALLAKGVSGNASALPASAVLRMATINGARALGLGEETGSLEPGKAADITAVDLGDPETQPVYHPVSQLVYATGRDKVSDVWIGGRQLLRDKQLTSMNLEEILPRATVWQARIANNAR